MLFSMTDTKFSSRELSRVGKYNRTPSLPASLPSYAPSALLRKERTSLKLSPFLPSMFLPSDKLPTWLIFYNRSPSLPPRAVHSGTSLGAEEILLPPSRG